MSGKVVAQYKSPHFYWRNELWRRGGVVIPIAEWEVRVGQGRYASCFQHTTANRGNPLILRGHEVTPNAPEVVAKVVARKAISGITAGLGVSCTVPPPLLCQVPNSPTCEFVSRTTPQLAFYTAI